MSRLQQVLDVQQLAEDHYRGASPATILQRTFGGQVAGQALVSATRTVPSELSVHSLHGYFLRPGDPTVPIDYEVDRIRDGRSFVTRRVTGVQHGKAIFTMAASFQTADDGPAHADPMPAHDDPESLLEAEGDEDWHEVHRSEWPEWDVRRGPRQPGQTTQQVWLRHRDRLPDDPVLHACALAYASDLTLLGCARQVHPHVPVQAASLDHAVWFLRPFRADDWLLYDQTSPSAAAGRALSQGRIFTRDGQLVAAVVQEGLMRFATSS